MQKGPRRIVTGLDAEGRSAIIIDDCRDIADSGAQFIWRTRASPADNSGNKDAGREPFDPASIHDREGSNFVLLMVEPEDGLSFMGMHATDTIDYIVVLKGGLELHTENNIVELAAGDIVVDRGVSHGWRAIGNEPAMMAVVMLPAHPVGKGATV